MVQTRASERSIVTVVAVDVVGSTKHILGRDPEDAQDFLDDCFDHFRDAVESQGGRLISYEGDGGIALFGWPVALEDHADRACAAAWRLQHPDVRPVAPSGQPVSFRVGVHSGLVGVRHLDLEGRSGWNAVGEVVNLAAKLQQLAPSDKVVVSAATIELCRTPLALVAAARSEGLALDAAYLLASPSPAGRYAVVRRQTPFVGRQKELQWLRDRVLDGAAPTRIALLVGEAGIGKSRLAHGLLGEAQTNGWRTLVFYGDSQTRASPFAAALAMIAGLLGLPDGAALSELAEAIDREGVDQETAGLLAKLLGRRAARGAANQMQIARAFVRVFLGTRRTQPLLVVVEDLHLVDRESQTVLHLLAPEPAEPAISLLLTGRPEAHKEMCEIGGAMLELQPLSVAEMRTLAHAVCPEGTPQEVIERVVERADGVAFVLEEIARSIGASPSGTALPASVESAIHARLGLLSREAREVAQALSLLGERVEADVLAPVAGVQAARLPLLLDELERFAFVPPSDDGRARFRHHIIAESCANTIARDRRASLHRAALTVLEARPRNVAGRSLRLAIHSEGAGDDPRALTLLWDAGVEARGTAAAASLNLIFDRAMAVIERIGSAAAKTYVDFVLMSFPSMLLLGEFAKMRLQLPRAMALAREQGRLEKVSNSLSQLGMLCWFEGRYDEGRRAAEEGREIARQLDLPPLIYSNQLMLANVLHGMGRIDLALTELHDLQAMLSGELAAERWGAPAIPLSTTLSFIGWVKADTNQLGASLEFSRRGLELARRERDPYAEIMARNAMGRTYLHMERFNDALSCLQVAWDLAEIHGYDATKSNLAGHMASALARLDRPQEAIAVAESCLTRQLHLRTGRMENFLLKLGYAEGLLRTGEKRRGLAVLDEALDIASEIANPGLLANGLELSASLRAELDADDPRIAADRLAAAATRDLVTGARGAPDWA